MQNGTSKKDIDVYARGAMSREADGKKGPRRCGERSSFGVWHPPRLCVNLLNRCRLYLLHPSSGSAGRDRQPGRDGRFRVSTIGNASCGTSRLTLSYLLIESSGISEPIQVAETFTTEFAGMFYPALAPASARLIAGAARPDSTSSSRRVAASGVSLMARHGRRVHCRGDTRRPTVRCHSRSQRGLPPAPRAAHQGRRSLQGRATRHMRVGSRLHDVHGRL